MKKWFKNRLLKVMAHNDYTENMLTASVCDERGYWSPADLIAREYLNNGGGSAKGFLGLTTAECVRCYNYMVEIRQELIDGDYISKSAVNNHGFPLWNNYDF